MRISDELIEQVLAGGGTEEEKRRVMDFLRDKPEKLAQFLTEKSWENFEVDSRMEAPSAKLLASIADKVGGPSAPVRKMRYGWVAAASVVVVGGLAVLLSRPKNDKVSIIKEQVTIAPAPTEDKIANTSLKPQTYSLPDGSTVKLAGNSSISFYRPFINNRRDIYLAGEAVFTVSKDGARPFAVHARDLTTTALGTVFSVSDKNSHLTTVHLYSGRVVVKGKSFADVYLQPGQQLLLNNNDLTIQVKTDKPKAPLAAAPVSEPQSASWQFTRQPLTEIFDLLQKKYSITILYKPSSLKNMDFTGTFDKEKETLESFLSTLCDLNELALKKTDSNSYVIQTK